MSKETGGKTASGSVSLLSNTVQGGAAGEVLYQSTTDVTAFTPQGTSGQALLSNGASPPTWGAAAASSSLAGGAAGDIPYQTAPSATGFSAPGTTGQILASGGTGAPTWTPTTGTGSVVLATAPTLVTPTLGAAAATSLTCTNNSGVLSPVTLTQTTTATTVLTHYSNSTDTNDVYMGLSDGNWPQTGAALIQTNKDILLAPNNTTAVRIKASGAVNIAGLTASQAVATDASKNLVSVATTGTGSVVLANTPTLTTPNIGAASAASLNVAGLTASQAVITDGSKNLVSVPAGTSGQVLQSNGAAAPSWATLSIAGANNLNGGAAGQVPYQSAPGTTGFSAAGATGQIMASGGTGAPTWTATTGTGSVVLANTPTLVTPSIGSATGSAVTLANSAAFWNPLTTNQSTAGAFSLLSLNNTPDATQVLMGMANASFGAGNALIQTATAKDIVLAPNNTTALTVKSGGNINVPGLTASQAVATDASKNLVSVATTGTGSVVLANTPTLTTPVIGAATGTSLQLSGLTASQAVATDASKNLVSVATTGTGSVVLANTPTLVTPNIGAASAASLNVAGLTASQAVATDASKNLVSVATTGTGSVVLATAPTLVTPSLGDATGASLALTNTSYFPLTLIQTALNAGNQIRLNNTNAGSTFNAAFGLSDAAYQLGAAFVQSYTGKDIFLAAGGSTALRARSSGIVQIPQLTASQAVATDSSSNLVSVANTGTGSNVLATTPTLVTPNIGAATGSSLVVAGTGTYYPFQGNNATTGGAAIAQLQNTADATTAKFGLGDGFYQTGCAFIDTNTAKDIILAPNAAIGLRIKAGGEVTQPNTANAAWGSMYYDSAKKLSGTAAGTAGQVLQSNGTAAPTWATLANSTANISGGTAGAILYQGAPSTTAFSVGVAGQILTSGGTGAPTWTSTTGGGNVVLANNATLVAPTLGAALATSLQLSGLTASQAVATDGSKNLVSVANTGTGSNVLATSPALVTPAIGDATGASATLTASTAAYTPLTMTNSLAGGFTLAVFKNSADTTQVNVGLADAAFGAGNALIQTTAAKDIVFAPNGATALTVKSGGNINVPGLTASQAVATDASKNLVSVANTGTGSNVLANTPTLTTPVIGAATGTSLQLSGLTASQAVATDASKNLVSVANTGTGSNVLATSPTLVTPTLGAATFTTLTSTNNSGTLVAITLNQTTTTATALTRYQNTADSNNVYMGLTDGNWAQTGAALIQADKDILLAPGNTLALRIKSGGEVTQPATANAAWGVMYYNSTKQFSGTAAGTAAQVLLANGAAAPTWSSQYMKGLGPTVTTLGNTGGVTTTYTSPATARYLKVTVIGAGGGGGGSQSVNLGGSGGGAGGGAFFYMNAFGATFTYKIYALGGTGGAANANGGDGNDVTLTLGGGSIVAGGGKGGFAGIGRNGAPGINTVTSFPNTYYAGYGGSGSYGGGNGLAGLGGIAPFIGGGQTGYYTTTGAAGSLGCGGAGGSYVAATNYGGGAGGEGVIIVEEYY